MRRLRTGTEGWPARRGTRATVRACFRGQKVTSRAGAAKGGPGPGRPRSRRGIGRLRAERQQACGIVVIVVEPERVRRPWSGRLRKGSFGGPGGKKESGRAICSASLDGGRVVRLVDGPAVSSPRAGFKATIWDRKGCLQDRLPCPSHMNKCRSKDQAKATKRSVGSAGSRPSSGWATAGMGHGSRAHTHTAGRKLRPKPGWSWRANHQIAIKNIPPYHNLLDDDHRSLRGTRFEDVARWGRARSLAGMLGNKIGKKKIERHLPNLIKRCGRRRETKASGSIQYLEQVFWDGSMRPGTWQHSAIDASERGRRTGKDVGGDRKGGRQRRRQR